MIEPNYISVSANTGYLIAARKQNGVYQSGTSLTHSFNESQVENSSTGNCVLLTQTGLVGALCNSSHHFICEKGEELWTIYL